MERNEFIEGFGKISSDCNRMTEKHDIHYMQLIQKCGMLYMSTRAIIYASCYYQI